MLSSMHACSLLALIAFMLAACVPQNCQLDSIGPATAYDGISRAYYVTDFGCAVTNTCRC